MTWVRLDDNFVDHPKVVGLSDSAFRLHVSALCYAASHLTDGFIAENTLARIGWASKDIRKDVTELLKSHLWVEHPDGYVVHDYLEYNPSAEQVKADREAAKERMRNVRKNGQPNKSDAFNGSSEEVRPNKQRSSPSPSPIPFPIPSDNKIDSDQSIRQQQQIAPAVKQIAVAHEPLAVAALVSAGILSSSHSAILKAWPDMQPEDVQAWSAYVDKINLSRRNGNKLGAGFIVDELKQQHKAPDEFYDALPDPDREPVMVLE